MQNLVSKYVQIACLVTFYFSRTILIAVSELCIINLYSNWYFNEKMGTCEDSCPMVLYIIFHYNDISGFSWEDKMKG